MKKLTMIAVFALLLFGFGQMAKAQAVSLDSSRPEKPSCEIGFHYDGELIPKKVCNEPCPWCVSIRPVCRIIWSWQGKCVKNGDTPPITPGNSFSSDGLVAILNAQCKDDQVIWSKWSACDYRFGNGKQFRFPLRDKYDASRSAFNGCFITGLQQSMVMRDCE